MGLVEFLKHLPGVCSRDLYWEPEEFVSFGSNFCEEPASHSRRRNEPQPER